ncbi:hypothetical protein [Deinococcus sp.]|uniref:hypothetical protein n=1 Tax=Deinococcus sp. TaxID=47478 RepID=UPI003CC67D34
MTDPKPEQTSHEQHYQQPAAADHPAQPQPQTAEPQREGQQGAQTEAPPAGIQQAPQTAQNRGEDALDVALQGSMITSDPPSSLMAEED